MKSPNKKIKKIDWSLNGLLKEAEKLSKKMEMLGAEIEYFGRTSKNENMRQYGNDLIYRSEVVRERSKEISKEVGK